MKKFLAIIIVLLFVSPAFSQSANDLFQQALVMERSEGKLLDANEIYERVIATGTDRALSAKALIRMGDNYERLGLRLARQAYQRVLDNYSEQQDTARIARDRLSFLLASMAEIELVSFENGVFKTHVMDIPDTMGKVSPDGRFLSYVDWNSGNVEILDLKTGKRKLVSSDGSWAEDELAFGDVSIWSPDSKELMYLWLPLGGGEVRIYNLKSGKTRVLVPSGNPDVPFPIKWSSDGKQLLAINERKNHITDAITLVNIETGKARTVSTLADNWHTFSMDMSPDQEHIVFESFKTGQRKNPNAPINIKVMSADGSSVRASSVVNNDIRSYSPLWDIKGEHVLYLSTFDGTTELWTQNMVNGQASGPPSLLFAGFEGFITAKGISSNDRYYYSRSIYTQHVYEQGVDFSSGEMLHNEHVISSANYGKQRAGVVSPNGKLFAFLTEEPGSQELLLVTNIKSGETKVHELPFDAQGIRRYSLIWSSDNSSVLFQTRKNSKPVLLSVNLEESSHVAIEGFEDFNFNPGYIVGKGYSSDGTRIFFASPHHFVEMDRRGSSKRVLHEFKNRVIISMSLSPDSKTAAFVLGPDTSTRETNGNIVLMTIRDGKMSSKDEARTDQGYSRMVGVTWTPDGKALVFAENRPNSGQQLYHLDLESGKRIKLGKEVFDEDQFRGVRVHPDGDKLTFWRETSELQLWALEGIDL